MNSSEITSQAKKRSSSKERPSRLNRRMAGLQTKTRNIEVTEFEERALEFMSHYAVTCRNGGLPWNNFSQKRIVEAMCNVLVNILSNPAPSWTPNVEANLGADFYDAVLNRLTGQTVVNEDGHVTRREN